MLGYGFDYKVTYRFIKSEDLGETKK